MQQPSARRPPITIERSDSADELQARLEELRAANAALQAQLAKDEVLLRESEVRLSALAGSTDEVVFEFDGDGKYLNVWTRNEALLFRPAHELIGRTLAEVFDEGWARHHVEKLRRVLSSGQPEVWQYRIDLPSGRSWFLGRMTPMPSLDGTRRTVACLVREITQQKHDEASRGAQHGVARALADSDSLAAAAPRVLAAIGESMQWDWGAFWTVDREGSRLRLAALWHAPDLAAADLDELSREIALNTGERGPSRVCETAQADWVANLPDDCRSPRNEVAARTGLRSAAAFAIFDLHLPKASDAGPPPVIAPAFAPRTGTVEIAGQTIPPPISGDVAGVIEFFSRDPRPRDEDQVAMLTVIGAQIGQFVKRKRAEAELRRSEQELRARQDMLDLAQQAARAVAFDWYIGARESENRWSAELEAMYGLQPGRFDRTVQGWKKLVHPDDWPSVKLAIERANESGGIDAEYRVTHEDGSVHWLQAKGRMFFDAGRRPERMVGFMIDVTDRRRAEEQLRGKDEALQLARAELARVSRVTTLGELTASIAHEVNQPLGAMVANAAACRRWLEADPPESAKARRALASIEADGRRAGEIIGRIRALVKRQAPRRDLVDVNRKIAQVIELAADEIRRNDIALRTELTEGLPPVEGDRVQLQQVLLNLMVNAIDAMSPIRDRPRELTVASRRNGPDAVLVEVRDTGPGIDPERAAQVFEPFYTTKSGGLGIGLSISRSIIEAHGGRLWVNPNEPQGAIFRFSLPAAPPAP